MSFLLCGNSLEEALTFLNVKSVLIVYSQVTLLIVGLEGRLLTNKRVVDRSPASQGHVKMNIIIIMMNALLIPLGK